ncbi:MAG: hypothetical protein LZ166_00985 [Thaumarchaeota archaeon]|nr:hypothetical protein [Nitrososphaerota archaeon]MCL7386089.1 hypothetical protein [Candidatus Wolframiiraptor allenii]
MKWLWLPDLRDARATCASSAAHACADGFSRCPWHGDGCGVRISRGLFKCTRIG